MTFILILIFLSGIRGVYQGVTATIMKQGSNQAIRFFVMETLKNAYTDGDSKKKIPKYVSIFPHYLFAVSYFI